MAEVIRYMDTDVVGGAGDGTSWEDAYDDWAPWHTAEVTDLVLDGDSHKLWVRGGSIGRLTLIGWNTGPSNRLVIEAADTDKATKTGIDNTKFRIVVTNEACINPIAFGYLTLRGLQIQIAASTTVYGIPWGQGGSAGELIIDGMYMEITTTGTPTILGVQSIDVDADAIVINSIFRLVGASTSISTGLYLLGKSHYAWNCIVDGFYVAYRGTLGKDHDVRYCVAKDWQQIISGISQSDIYYFGHIAAWIGNNPVTVSGDDWDNEFVDADNGDYTLLDTGNFYHGGSTNPNSAYYTTDIDGNDYNVSNYSIGADEHFIPVTAWDFLPGISGDAYVRMCGTSGDAWARLPGSTGDAWTRLIAACIEDAQSSWMHRRRRNVTALINSRRGF